MSVWQQESLSHPLRGELVSVSLAAEPRDLEDVLEILAELPFPVNPRLFHKAAWASPGMDGHEENRLATIVEFPAYAAHLPEIRRKLAAGGFPDERLRVYGMWEEIHPRKVAQGA
ncbi:MAG: hypothetical protein WD696_11615 [Bryobacteraceae bacterium]